MITIPMTLWLGIGWTMLHFLWVGGVVAGAAALVLRQIPGTSAEMRYAIALASLVLLALTPPAIAWRLARTSGSDWSGLPAHDVDQVGPATFSPAKEARGVVVIGDVQRQKDRASPQPVAVPPVVVDRRTVTRPSWLATRLDALATCLPWLWLTGSPLTFAWLALGFAGAERLRRRSRRLRAGKRSTADLPAVGRFVRDRPGCGRGGLRPSRHSRSGRDHAALDPLAGGGDGRLGARADRDGPASRVGPRPSLGQFGELASTIDRVVAFLSSGRMDRLGVDPPEREHCCDRIVVAHTGKAHVYAEMLLALASAPVQRALISVALVPYRKHLVRRIRQILTPRKDHPMKLSRSLILSAAVVTLAPALWIATHAGSQRSQNAQTSPNASAPVASAHAKRKKSNKKMRKPLRRR